MTTRLAPLILAAATLLAGCESLPRVDGARFGPFYEPVNYRGVERLPAEVRRVAILPVAAIPAVPEENLNRIDSAVLAAFTRTARAEVVPVSRDVLARLGGSRQLDSTGNLPPNFLSRVQSETAADAVLFVDVTTYSAYPPLALGLRARLVQVNGGDLLWAFDNVFDAQSPAVANAARRHFLTDANSTTHVADVSATVLQNPSRFASYAASAAFVTLPIR